ncbi:hypothetical protein [Candidatus Protochlamydia sp. R18]|uniref:hypothetical protein n=1 Tax=Candidatus Protochlamydia sp. R18 TaxID=1353977 RepID=UPI0011DC7F5F|nr:hypothetical protein [Candidatus Protochlamydia sp. R18]
MNKSFKSFFKRSSFLDDRAIPITNYPRLISFLKIASPIPEEAPVTNSSFSSDSLISLKIFETKQSFLNKTSDLFIWKVYAIAL